MYLLNHKTKQKFYLGYLDCDSFTKWINSGAEIQNLPLYLLSSIGSKSYPARDILTLLDAIITFLQLPDNEDFSLSKDSQYEEVAGVHDYLQTTDEHLSNLATQIPQKYWVIKEPNIILEYETLLNFINNFEK